jgi:PqqD family protein of HPr-rel-A system
VPLVKPLLNDALIVVELDGEAVVYDERTGDLHHLNPTATVVLTLCDGTSSIRQMAEDIANAVGVSLEQVEPQVRSTLRSFRKVGLLVPSGSGTKQAVV